MLHKPPFDESGRQTLCQVDGVCADMMMDIFLQRMRAGEELTLSDPGKETAVLLTQGDITLGWGERRERCTRSDVFTAKPYALHVPAGTDIRVTANTDSEIVVQKTGNPRVFDARFYTPEDCLLQHFGATQWEGTAKRDVLTVFDYTTAPYSNMVLGEVVGMPGRWSSYIPHSHDQPEVYYYKFDRLQGFGAAFIGDDVYKVTHGSFSAIPGGVTHPQVTAPGYRMYICWMIRHLDGNPWTDRVNDPAHTWLLDSE